MKIQPNNNSYEKKDKTKNPQADVYRLFDSFIKTVFIEKKDFFDNNAISFDGIDAVIEKYKKYSDSVEKENKEKRTNNEKTSVVSSIYTKFKEDSSSESDMVKRLLTHAEWLWSFPVNNNFVVKFMREYDDKDIKAKCISDGLAVGSYGQSQSINKKYEIPFILQLFKIVNSQTVLKDVNNIKNTIKDICLECKYGGEPLKYQEISQNYIDDNRNLNIIEVLLHLTDPDNYETIATFGSKKNIVSFFGNLVDSVISKTANQDQMLQNIRSALSMKEQSFFDPEYRCFWDIDGVSDISEKIDALNFKKNIILYGPPGTGKTHFSKKFARIFIELSILNSKNAAKEKCDYIRSIVNKENPQNKTTTESIDNHIHRLQLHQNYKYENFIIGQTIIDGVIEPKEGYFFNLCNSINASKDKTPHVLILDEINRVDLARLFGEAFSCIENRGEEGKVDLQFENKFLVVPDNLYIIGTMNEIDFSLEKLDFALRRRFLWFPQGYSENSLKGIIESNLESEYSKFSKYIDKYANCATKLNEAIDSIEELGPKYEIGHAFFADIAKIIKEDNSSSQAKTKVSKAKENIWKYSIFPMIEAYLDNIDDETKANTIKSLKDIWDEKDQQSSVK